MGGFGEFFGFDGRVNRLGLLWRGAAAGAGLAALAAGGAAALVTVNPGGVGGLETWTQRLTIAVMLLSLWCGLGLTSRRLRDIGVEPVYVVPAYAALWVANAQLLEPLSRLQPQGFEPLEAGWMALQGLLALALLLWPSRAAGARPVLGPTAFVGQPTAYLDWRASN
jgi:uncharacterized membrane protein YhaH (DUF805 family)